MYCNLSNHQLSLTVCYRRRLIVGVVGIALHTEQVVLCAFIRLQTLVTPGESTSLSQRDGGIKAQPLKDTAVLWGLHTYVSRLLKHKVLKLGEK